VSSISLELPATAHAPARARELVREATADWPGINHFDLDRRKATEEGGRGLFLVDALSDSWGLSGDRSSVWFEVVARA
jgi:hypothetical protein